jgi:hypothetical protein
MFEQAMHVHGPAVLQPQSRGKRAAGLLLAVLIHMLIIAAVLLYRAPQKPPSSQGEKVVINLLPLSEDKPAAAAPPPPRPRALPSPKPRPAPAQVSRAAPPPEIVVPPLEVEPPPQPPPPVNAAPPMDMQSYIANKRREAAQQAAPSAPAASEPSANDIAMANINRNLQSIAGRRPGTRGVFEILYQGQREARFAFNGWTPGIGGNWREVVDVDAGLGGNVELAIIRKMIEMIRSHYKGDFNWQSHRLNRVVVMSARPQDNAELEAFLMQEFFAVRR